MNKLGNVYIIIILSFVILIVYYAFFSTTNFNYEVIYCDTDEDIPLSYNNENLKIYCCDSENNIKPVYIKNSSNENIYLEIFQLYNIYQNSLPVDYYSPLNGICEVNKIINKDNILIIDIKALPNECNYNLLFECLKQTYKEYGIETVQIQSTLSKILIK